MRNIFSLRATRIRPVTAFKRKITISMPSTIIGLCRPLCPLRCLRVLLALESLPRQSDADVLSDRAALERAARDALEAAYSSQASHG